MYNFLMMFATSIIPSWVWIVVGVEIVVFGIVLFFILKKLNKTKGTHKKATPAQEKALGQAKQSMQEQKNKEEQLKSQQNNVFAQPDKKAEEVKTNFAPIADKAEPVKQEIKAEPFVGQVKPEPAMQSSTVSQRQPAKEEVVATAPAVQPVQESASVDNMKIDSKDYTYHVSKRFIDDKWQIKLNDSARAMRIFDTQAEALQYATDLAHKKNGNVVVHKRSEK